MSFLWVLLISVFSTHSFAMDTSRLTIMSNSVTIFSGPSLKYRPLRVVGKGRALLVSKQIVQTPNEGDFYKVLVIFKGGRKQIGYISVKEKVKIEKASNEDDMENYKSLSLSESAMQTAFYRLQSSDFFWTLGYQKYPAPSFYLKMFVGQFLSSSASSILFGGEIGTDHLVTDALSFFTAFSFGGAIIPEEGVLFTGSKPLNLFMQGGSGIRYNAELAAVSFSLIQALVLNQNNSFVSWGFGLTLEVGL